MNDLMHCSLRLKGTERYEILVLLPNSEHTKSNNIKYQQRNADACTVYLHWKTFSINNGGYEVRFGRFKLPITSLFVVRNIKCGYSFS